MRLVIYIKDIILELSLFIKTIKHEPTRTQEKNTRGAY